MNLNVLLVEDDYDLAASLVEYLELEHITCDHAANGLHGMELITQNKYDVLLLDVMMPKMDGLSLCDSLRKDGVDTPVLMLTARDTLDDKVAGFEVGTDDYLVKPFALKELLIRVRALAKRRSSQPRKYTVADLELDTGAVTATRNGKSLLLTPTEWKLLLELTRNSPHVVTRDQLIRAVWGEDTPESNTLKVHMHKLRQKVDKPFPNALITTLPRHGFALRNDHEKST
ncbi:response regulator transcription factor [Halodesulfovibrio marinisediminis]|uniref:DNA-binding response regulator, OmpR family, contains REC and winged-helix (WHTH) domain n=1 Tax=Halodesulfovibrio marinisediminis DSM 17456 TaxID=1121457 RepID=A0A1N6GQL9_9BACT|nr:response regulator transcription factor [Halodesulfovibrio marinisediminis]SIO09793.1 DNA-binding response regulator, OmpR family, contains REC and winged-helix (wHTH) domain [Halodesulfovibrio marinisediminis DSM 17456]